MSDDKIPALWFDKGGCGPSDLALQLRSFPSEMEGRIPPTLGIQIKQGDPVIVDVPNGTRQQVGPIVYGAADILVGSGFMLGREQVEALRQQLEQWLKDNP